MQLRNQFDDLSALYVIASALYKDIEEYKNKFYDNFNIEYVETIEKFQVKFKEIKRLIDNLNLDEITRYKLDMYIDKSLNYLTALLANQSVLSQACFNLYVIPLADATWDLKYNIEIAIDTLERKRPAKIEEYDGPINVNLGIDVDGIIFFSRLHQAESLNEFIKILQSFSLRSRQHNEFIQKNMVKIKEEFKKHSFTQEEIDALIYRSIQNKSIRLFDLAMSHPLAKQDVVFAKTHHTLADIRYKITAASSSDTSDEKAIERKAIERNRYGFIGIDGKDLDKFENSFDRFYYNQDALYFNDNAPEKLYTVQQLIIDSDWAEGLEYFIRNRNEKKYSIIIREYALQKKELPTTLHGIRNLEVYIVQQPKYSTFADYSLRAKKNKCLLYLVKSGLLGETTFGEIIRQGDLSLIKEYPSIEANYDKFMEKALEYSQKEIFHYFFNLKTDKDCSYYRLRILDHSSIGNCLSPQEINQCLMGLMASSSSLNFKHPHVMLDLAKHVVRLGKENDESTLLQLLRQLPYHQPEFKSECITFLKYIRDEIVQNNFRNIEINHDTFSKCYAYYTAQHVFDSDATLFINFFQDDHTRLEAVRIVAEQYNNKFELFLHVMSKIRTNQAASAMMTWFLSKLTGDIINKNNLYDLAEVLYTLLIPNQNIRGEADMRTFEAKFLLDRIAREMPEAIPAFLLIPRKQGELPLIHTIKGLPEIFKYLPREIMQVINATSISRDSIDHDIFKQPRKVSIVSKSDSHVSIYDEAKESDNKRVTDEESSEEAKKSDYSMKITAEAKEKMLISITGYIKSRGRVRANTRFTKEVDLSFFSSIFFHPELTKRKVLNADLMLRSIRNANTFNELAAVIEKFREGNQKLETRAEKTYGLFTKSSFNTMLDDVLAILNSDWKEQCQKGITYDYEPSRYEFYGINF